MDVKLTKIHGKRNSRVGGFVVQASRHILMLILFAVLFAGLLTGNFLLKSSSETYNAVSDIFQNYLTYVSGKTFIKIFLDATLINLSIVFLNFVFGLCAVGFPVPVIIMLVKGISIGALSAFMYSEYALKGFGYCMLVFYPVQIASCLVLLRAGKESFLMSTNLFRFLTEQKQNNIDICSFKIYIIRYLILCIITIIIALVSTLLVVYIVPLMNF